jgi:hypothetical protein
MRTPDAALLQEPRLLGLLSDYQTLCAPHVPAIREVLEGRAHRYKLRYNGVTFIFHHGCLMTQVLHDGLLRALPPFSIERDDTPVLHALPEHQQGWLDEFLTLPKDVLLFYFSLLKEVFKGYPLRSRWEDPATGRRQWVPVPEMLQPVLAEVGWHIR